MKSLTLAVILKNVFMRFHEKSHEKFAKLKQETSDAW